jgi:excisionase family DNA binding protein
MSTPYPATTIIDQLRSSPTHSVEASAKALGISRALAYRLAKSGDLPVIRLGPTRVRVPTAALLKMLGVDD